MLEDVQNKITRLIALYEGEKQRADELAESLSKSREDLQDRQRQIAELKDKIENGRLQNAFASGGNQEAKSAIAALIGEIDKCLALLKAD